MPRPSHSPSNTRGKGIPVYCKLQLQYEATIVYLNGPECEESFRTNQKCHSIKHLCIYVSRFPSTLVSFLHSKLQDIKDENSLK